MNTPPNASLVVSVALTAACCSRPQRVAVLVAPRAGSTFSGARSWWLLRGRFHRALSSASWIPVFSLKFGRFGSWLVMIRLMERVWT